MFKTLIVMLFGLLACSTNAVQAINGEFIKGFEVGIFMRGQTKMLKQYDCSDVTKKNSKEYAQIMNLIEPIKMVAKMNKDKEVHKIVDTLDIFIVNIGKLLAIFNDDYSGTDFCAGAIFGMNGSDMLIKISQTVLESKNENHLHNEETGSIEVENTPASDTAFLKSKMGKAGRNRRGG